MEIVKTVELLPSASRTATGTVDFDAPAGAAGVQVFTTVTAASGTTPTLASKVSHLAQDGNAIDLITAANLTTVGRNRLGVVPGCAAQANIMANEPISPRMRYTPTSMSYG